MASSAEVIANEAEIKQAMGVLGLANWADGLLDEIELDRRLKISLEQFEKGQAMPVEEAERRINEKIATGYHDGR